MKDLFKKNYIILLLPLLIGGVVLSFIFRQNNQVQLQILIGAMILYIVFSLLHHFFDKTLTLEVAIEYILIAALIFIILSGAF